MLKINKITTSRPQKWHHIYHFHHNSFLPIFIVSSSQEWSCYQQRVEPPLSSSRTSIPYRASQNKRFIAMAPCEWLCCCQILNTVHRNQERKYAPTSFPDLLAQRGHRGFALLLCTLAEPELAAKEGCVLHWLPLLHRAESGTERAEGAAAESILFTGLLFKQKSRHPRFCLLDYEFSFVLQKLFFLKPSRGKICRQKSYLFLVQLIHLGWESSSGLANSPGQQAAAKPVPAMTAPSRRQFG